MTGNGLVQLTAKDFKSDQEVRWCPGCGDYAILAGVQSFLPELGIPRENLVFVSGIGCAARFPYYLETYGMHSIHGRAPAIATGLATSRPDLSVWVVTGDGDALSIGGNHLIHALRRNVNVTILLFNNRIYGLTKGQYSPTSERGKVTKSTPLGSVDQPFNPLSIAIGAEATFVARAIDTDKPGSLEVLRAAAAHRGAAFVEILQNCNIYNDGAFDVVRNEKENRLYLQGGRGGAVGRPRRPHAARRDARARRRVGRWAPPARPRSRRPRARVRARAADLGDRRRGAPRRLPRGRPTRLRGPRARAGAHLRRAQGRRQSSRRCSTARTPGRSDLFASGFGRSRIRGLIPACSGTDPRGAARRQLTSLRSRVDQAPAGRRLPATRTIGPMRAVIFSTVPPAVHGLVASARSVGIEPVALLTPRAARDAEAAERRQALLAESPAGLDLCFVESKASLERLTRVYEPDLGLCAGYTWLLPPEVLAIPRLGVVNNHPSLLPRHRGPYPIAWAIREGDTELGMTVHLMDEQFDTGPILAQGARPMPDGTSIEAFAPVLQSLGAELLPGALSRVLAGDRGEPQTEVGASYAPAFGEDYAELDPRRTRVELERQVRAWSLMFDRQRHGPDRDARRRARPRAGGDASRSPTIPATPRLEAADGPLWLVSRRAALRFGSQRRPFCVTVRMTGIART